LFGEGTEAGRSKDDNPNRAQRPTALACSTSFDIYSGMLDVT